MSPPASSWQHLLGPVARLLGRGVIDQLFSRMAGDTGLVLAIARKIAEREDPDLVWVKLSSKERQLWQQRVEETLRAVGQHILD